MADLADWTPERLRALDVAVAEARGLPWTLARIEESVEKIAGASGCWIWMRSKTTEGYGTFNNQLAHRLAWSVYTGQRVPDGICVLHRCDVPLCVRPDHLWVGTRESNNKDRNMKGRQARGVKAARPGAKLTEEAVLAVREAEGTHKEIAKRFGIARPTVTQIRSFSTWQHLAANGRPFNG